MRILYALHRKGFDNEVGEGYHVGEKENSNRIIFFLSFNLLLPFCLSNHGFWLSIGLGVICLDKNRLISGGETIICFKTQKPISFETYLN